MSEDVARIENVGTAAVVNLVPEAGTEETGGTADVVLDLVSEDMYVPKNDILDQRRGCLQMCLSKVVFRESRCK